MANTISPETILTLQQRNFAEFFAGIGLVRAGLEKQGWSISFANDIDPIKYEMYKGHFTDAESHFILNDIYNISVSSKPRVTIATASFPCKDLSLAGGRDGLDGKHSSTFWGFIKVLKEWKENKPPFILLENVPGFLSANKGQDFFNALKAINDLGYLTDTFILDAVNFVPQSRQRLFIVGFLEDIFQPVKLVDVMFDLESNLRPKNLTKFILGSPSIKWTIRKLPPLLTNVTKLENVIEDIPVNSPLWWSTTRTEYLLNQMSPRHREIAEAMIKMEKWSYGTIFRRMRNKKSTAELRSDGIAGCLRTPAGGSAKQILFKAGNGQSFARLITPREAAGLMGIADYKITVPFDQGLFGFGDAVCVPVIEWIAKYYLNPIIDELVQEYTNKLVLRGA